MKRQPGKIRIFAPFGFYGAGNTGDEATLQGFARLLQMTDAKLKATLVSQNARHTARVEPHFRYIQDRGHRDLRHRIANHAAHGYVFAGGTPIQDSLGGWPLDAIVPMVQAAARWQKPVAFVGVGVETIAQHEYRAKFRDVIAPNVVHWTVRSANDRDRLLDLVVPESRITVAADMAWLLPRSDLAYGRKTLGDRVETGRPLIAVNLNAEASVLERAPGLYATLAAALDRIIDAHNARVVFLFNEIREGPSYDMATAEQVRRLMNRADAAFALPNDYFSPAEMMSIIGACALAISTRYHFCMFAALQGVPFVALERSDKISDFCADLYWPFGTRLEEASPATLAEHARLLLTAPGPVLKDMEPRITDLRARAKVNARGLDALQSAVAEAPGGQRLRRAISRVFDRTRDKPA